MRIILCEPGIPATVLDEPDPWARIKRQLDDATIQILDLEDGVVILSDENGADVLPLNRLIPDRARMPEGWREEDVIFRPEEAALPGEEGVHRIFGDFILTRYADGTSGFADLTDADVEKYMSLLNAAWLEKENATS